MKRAVVLSGGGTKGAYEIGVWRALKELGIDYQIVTGTSIGSVNGALMAMGDYDRAEEIWKRLVMSDFMNAAPESASIYNETDVEGVSLEESVKKKHSFGTVDNAPFLDFVKKHIDEQAVRASAVDYGLVTVRLRERKPYLMTKETIPDGLLHDYIISSSSVYPIFPMHMMGEDHFVDGMYYDNLPIDLAITMGAGDLIVVDLHQDPQHPNYVGRPYVTYITPSEKLGGILDFDKSLILRNMEMGYRDAMRTFGVHRGFIYSFEPTSIKKHESAIEKFNAWCARGEAAIGQNGGSRLMKKAETYRMYHELEKYARGNAVKKEDYFIRGAELAAEFFGITHERVWRMDDLVTAIRGELGSKENYPDLADFYESRSVRKLSRKVLEIRRDRTPSYLVGCLYYADKKHTLTYENLIPALALMPGELAAALFLRAVDDEY